MLTIGVLLHQLLLVIADLPALCNQSGPDGVQIGLILHEPAAAPVLPVFAPLPPDPRLGALCRLDYESPPAVSTMVRRMLGRPPSALGPDAPGQPGPVC